MNKTVHSPIQYLSCAETGYIFIDSIKQPKELKINDHATFHLQSLHVVHVPLKETQNSTKNQSSHRLCWLLQSPCFVLLHTVLNYAIFVKKKK